MFSKTRQSAALAAAICLAAAVIPAQAADQMSAADTAVAIIPAFRNLFSGERGLRPVHTKGTLTQGVFTPFPEAATLSRAEHFNNGPAPVQVRLSNFMGLPSNPDGGAAATPHGMAIKFSLGDHDTDLVAHSYNGFPAATPDAMLGFLTALAAGKGALEPFLAQHSEARAFIDAPEPAPVSWANETFYGVNAFLFTNAAGQSHFGRYVITPLAGDARLDAAAAAAAAPDYLENELAHRLAQTPVQWRIAVQLAADGDQVTDGSRPWPNDRALVVLGTLKVDAIVPASADMTRSLLFNPLNLVDGILPSEDPMLAARGRAYGASYRERMH